MLSTLESMGEIEATSLSLQHHSSLEDQAKLILQDELFLKARVQYSAEEDILVLDGVDKRASSRTSVLNQDTDTNRSNLESETDKASDTDEKRSQTRDYST